MDAAIPHVLDGTHRSRSIIAIWLLRCPDLHVRPILRTRVRSVVVLHRSDRLSFIPIGVGYVTGWLSFIPAILRNYKERLAKPNDERAQYESRLWWLLFTAPCLPIGLFGFAWTILGPPSTYTDP